jgi:hypothetical protein
MESKILLASTLVLLSGSAALAQCDDRYANCSRPPAGRTNTPEDQPGVYLRQNFNDQTLSNSFKCEIGEFAQTLGGVSLKAEKLKAKVTVSLKRVNSGSFGGSIKVPFFDIGGSASSGQGVTQTEDVSITYNIHVDNRINCKKVHRVPIGVAACLRGKRALFIDAAENEGSVGCTTQVNATAKAGANAKFPIWIITIGPDFSWENTVTYSVGVSAPPAAKKE